MKRTDGNDWGYYSVGAAIQQRGIRNWLGEYYLPCFAYQSNAIVNFTPCFLPAVTGAFAAWAQLYANIRTMPMDGLPSRTRAFLNRVAENDDSALHARAEDLHTIIGGQVSVLPPDTRHVDYELIPLNIADGCLYHCKFCCVKSSKRFIPRSMENIREQIRNLITFYGRNLQNYNALFLGNHDALADLLCNVSDIPPGKGAVYLSPLAGHHQESDELLQSFFEIKNKSRLPVFFYLIQRL